MSIRQMNWDDLEAAAEIEAVCFREGWSKPMLEESFSAPWSRFWGAEEGGRLFGYGVMSVIAGEGEILRIAVLKGFRRRGTGRKLLEAMVTDARNQGAGAMTLEVRESNATARRLYISAGFREEARRREYYRNPREDAIIMWNRNLR